MNNYQSNSRPLTGFIAAMLLGALAAGCGGSDGRGAILGLGDVNAPPVVDVTPPTVITTVPADGAVAVPTNIKITATFSEDMDPASILAAGTFTVCAGAAPCVAVGGTVTYTAASRTAIFTPTAPLAINTTFTATVSNAANDVAGNALVPGPVPNPWTFTTGNANDVTAPSITATNPVDLSTGKCLQQTVNATFSEDMDPATLNTTTFTLQLTGPPLGAVLAGSVSYDAASRIATLTLNNDLLSNTSYTATLTTGVQDLAGNPLAAGATPNPWRFTTGTSACSQAPALGAAQTFGNLGGTAGSTNTGLLTVVNGDMSSTATATSAITGFHDTAGDIYTQTPANQGSVAGHIYSCTVSTTGPTSAAVNPTSCSIAAQARHDAETAYNNLAGLAGGCALPCAANLASATLLPGVYTAPSGSFLIQGGDLTLDAQGDANAVWVFQMATTLTVGGPGVAFPQSVLLVNGAQAKNVYWQVGSSATINAAGGGTMVGTILAFQGVSLSTVGPPVRPVLTVNGRVAGLNASVTMTNTVINVPGP